MVAVTTTIALFAPWFGLGECAVEKSTVYE
jgi:hypothetical protein